MENVIKSEIELGLTFIVLNLVYKFYITYLWGTYIVEWKPNVGWTEGQEYKHVKLNTITRHARHSFPHQFVIIFIKTQI